MVVITSVVVVVVVSVVVVVDGSFLEEVASDRATELVSLSTILLEHVFEEISDCAVELVSISTEIVESVACVLVSSAKSELVVDKVLESDGDSRVVIVLEELPD